MGRPRLYANATARQRAHRQKLRHHLQAPCVEISPTCRLYHGDARVLAPLLQHIDALIADPPYGTNFDFTTARRSRQPLLHACSTAARWADNITGDEEPFDPAPWLNYRHIILWGGNHYASRLPDSGAWLVWDKRRDSTPDDHADAEMAWTNLPGVTRLYRHKWRGIVRDGEANVSRRPKYHPAEKPLELMEWCVAMTTGTVLDPFMGSGTTGEACVRLGRAFVGIELDRHYFQVACDRLDAAARQGRLFPAPPRTT
jgi:site-specific DNA-methyltransferase (adenine-specific)